MYVPESQPNWAKCSTPFCPNRDLYDNLEPIGISDPEGADAPRFCKKCLREMSEEAMADLKADREHRRILRKMRDHQARLEYAHGGTFFLVHELISGEIVEVMEKYKYLVRVPHPHVAHVFDLTDYGRQVADQP